MKGGAIATLKVLGTLRAAPTKGKKDTSGMRLNGKNYYSYSCIIRHT